MERGFAGIATVHDISNGTLVSLEEFREELFQVMQSPGYMKPICERSRYRESMRKIQEFLKKA